MFLFKILKNFRTGKLAQKVPQEAPPKVPQKELLCFEFFQNYTPPHPTGEGGSTTVWAPNPTIIQYYR